MRKFGNQPLYPTNNSFSGAGKFKNTTAESQDEEEDSQTAKKVLPTRRMKAFSTPRPLATTLVAPKPATDNDDEEEQASFGAYAAFLAADEKVGKISSSRKPQPSSTGKRQPSSIGGKRFNAPLLPTSGPGNANSFVESESAPQKTSYMKKKRPQPFLPTNLDLTQESENGNGFTNGEIVKSFQPLSRKVNRFKNSVPQEFVETFTENDVGNQYLDEEPQMQRYIRHSEGGNDVVIEKTKSITFDFAGSAKGKRTKPENVTESVSMFSESKIERGRKLQGMLRLDPCSVQLLSLQELDYEKYMSTVRTHNCVQVMTQTFDDGMEEGTQTDPVHLVTKWTQKPTGWLASGEDTIDNKGNDGGQSEKLNKFLFRSCRLMLSVLSSQKLTKLPTGNSKNLVKLQKSANFLKDSTSHLLCSEGELIACCDSPTDATDSTIVTVWTWRQPTVPLYFLRTFSKATSLAINSQFSLILVGCQDASINCFNLRESPDYHTQEEEEGETIRPPSVSTGCWSEQNHESQITGISVVPETKSGAQLISLDKSRLLVCWTLSLQVSTAESVWSNLKLVIRHKINLLELLSLSSTKLSSLRVWQTPDSSNVNIIVATNSGFMSKGVLRGGSIEPIEKYSSGFQASSVVVTVTSFDIQLSHRLIIASYDDGFCRLFRFGRSQPILILNCFDNPLKIQWSRVRSSMFYVGYRNKVEFWDILQSDVVPETQIQFNGLKDLEIFNSGTGEFIAILSADGLSFGSPPSKVEPLSPKDESRFKMYIKIIT